MSFVLVFWSDPPSSSVVNQKDVVGSIEVGQRRLIKWHGKEIMGKLIRTGYKKDLIKIEVSTDGDEWDESKGPDCQKVRERKDLLDERQRKAVQHKTAEAAAKDHFLYNLTFEAQNEDLMDDDDDEMIAPEIDFSGCKSVEDMVKILPRPMTKSSISRLLSALPCLKETNGNNNQMLKLCSKYNVYVDGANAWGLSKLLRSKPSALFENILLECVPSFVLALPFVSCSGTRKTVGLPKKIPSAISLYVNLKCSMPFTTATKTVNNIIKKYRKDKETQDYLQKLLNDNNNNNNDLNNNDLVINNNNA